MTRVALVLLIATTGCGRSGFGDDDLADGRLPELVGFPTPTSGVSPTPVPTGIPQCEESSDPDLVRCWPFDGSSTNASSYGGNQSVANLGYVSGVVGSAASFGSSTNFSITHDAIFNGPDITIEGWIRIASLPSSRVTLVHKDPSYRLSIAPSGALQCLVDQDDSLSTMAGTIPIGAWVHIACTHRAGSGNRHRIYVNGVEVADAAAQDGLATSTQDLRVGETSGGAEQFVGWIDALRLWRVARTGAQVCAAAGGTGC